MTCSPNANASLIPSMSLTMKGESQFTVYDPIIVISTPVMFSSWFLFSTIFVVQQQAILNTFLPNDMQSELVYCLAIVKGTELNIIGRKSCTLHLINSHNFMDAYAVFSICDVIKFKPRQNYRLAVLTILKIQLTK